MGFVIQYWILFYFAVEIKTMKVCDRQLGIDLIISSKIPNAFLRYFLFLFEEVF
jgi:hypothetical protein